MTEAQTMQLVWAVGAIVLVSSALSLRKVGLGPALRMIAGWVLIFGLALVAASYRQEISTAVGRVMGDLSGERAEVVGGEYRVPMSNDGHFWLRAEVNGVAVRFLVDSGATFTAVSPDTVREAGLEVVEGGLPLVIQTAAGQVAARRTVIDSLVVGPIEARQLTAITSPAFQSINVVGMNFLTQLQSWRVEGRTLILTPHEQDETADAV